MPHKAAVNLTSITLELSTCGKGGNRTYFEPSHMAKSTLEDKDITFLSELSPSSFILIPVWTKTLEGFPDLSEDDVSSCLLGTHEITKDIKRKYKTWCAFKLKDEIHSEYFSRSSSDVFIYLKSKCNPSQSTSDDDVKMVMVVLDKYSGCPVAGYCTCTAGYVLDLPPTVLDPPPRVLKVCLLLHVLICIYHVIDVHSWANVDLCF